MTECMVMMWTGVILFDRKLMLGTLLGIVAQAFDATSWSRVFSTPSHLQGDINERRQWFKATSIIPVPVVL